jgi:hypothetical protein
MGGDSDPETLCSIFCILDDKVQKLILNIWSWGRVIAQAVSRRLPTAAAWVRTHVRSCGICGRRSGTGAGFLQVFRFPLSILIPQIVPYSSSGAGTIGQLVADVPSGLSLTPPQETKKTSCLTVGNCAFPRVFRSSVLITGSLALSFLPTGANS